MVEWSKTDKQSAYHPNHAEDQRFLIKPNLYYKRKNGKRIKVNTKGKKLLQIG